MYTNALSLKPKSYHIYAKRAMVHLKLNGVTESIKDSNLCIALRPEWPMGYLCKSIAHWVSSEHLDAFSDIACGLVIDPTNPSLQIELKRMMSSQSKSLIVLNEPHHIEPICDVLAENGIPVTTSTENEKNGFREEIEKNIEKIVLVTSSLENFAEFVPYVINGVEYVMLLQTPENTGLLDGDLIYSLNGTCATSLTYEKICHEFGLKHQEENQSISSCQVIGIVNRWSTIAPKDREASNS